MNRLCVRFSIKELEFPESEMLRPCTAEDRRDAFAFTKKKDIWNSGDETFQKTHPYPIPPQGTGLFFPLYVISYLGSDFSDRELDVKIYEDWNQTQSDNVFEVSGLVPEDGILERDAKLCIQSFVTQLNEYGVPCRQDFGQVILSLGDVAKECECKEGKDVKKIFREEMRINELPTDQRLKFRIKISLIGLGTVFAGPATESVFGKRNNKLSCLTRSTPFDRNGKEITFKKEKNRLDNLGENFDAVSEIMNRYANKTNALESSFKRFIRGVKRVKCTTAPSSVTLSNTDLELPIVTYIMGQKLDVLNNYWIKSLILFADRCRALAGERLEEDVESRALGSVLFLRNRYFSSSSPLSTVEGKASLAIDYICLFPQMIEYAQDISYSPQKAKQILAEIFGNAFTNNAGDCEDITHAIYLFFRAFASSEFDVKKSIGDYFDRYDDLRSYPILMELKEASIEILAEMQRISRAYIPFLVIEGVSSPNVEHSKRDEEEEGDVDGKREESDVPDTEENKGVVVSGAHGALKLIPADYFSSCLNRWNARHVLSRFLASEVKENAVLHPDLSGTLPILIGEGTGILEGGTQKDAFPKQREAVYYCPLTEKIKRPLIPGNRNRSPFYKALVFGFTDEFLERFKIGKFHFCTALKSGKTGRGQLYEDFMARRQNTMVIPNVLWGDDPQEAVEFDEDMTRIVDRVIRIKTPLPTITGPGYLEDAACRSAGQLYGSLQRVIVDIERYVEESPLPTTKKTREYNSSLYYHHDSASPLTLLKRMAEEFHDSDILKRVRTGRYVVISLYANENHVDEEFVTEMLRFYEKRAKGRDEEKVGDVKIYRENLDENFYVYRLDFRVYTMG